MAKPRLISRRTRILLLVAMASWAMLGWRAWEFRRPCREWKHVHPGVDPNAPVKLEDGSEAYPFNPCTVIS